MLAGRGSTEGAPESGGADRRQAGDLALLGLAVRVRGADPAVEVVLEGEKIAVEVPQGGGKATPTRGSARGGQDQPELRRRLSGSRGSWLSEGKHE
jgi:hypothetical protein